WPMTSNGLQVSTPSRAAIQASGSERSRTSSVAGVRARTATASSSTKGRLIPSRLRSVGGGLGGAEDLDQRLAVLAARLRGGQRRLTSLVLRLQVRPVRQQEADDLGRPAAGDGGVQRRVAGVVASVDVEAEVEQHRDRLRRLGRRALVVGWRSRAAVAPPETGGEHQGG